MVRFFLFAFLIVLTFGFVSSGSACGACSPCYQPCSNWKPPKPNRKPYELKQKSGVPMPTPRPYTPVSSPTPYDPVPYPPAAEIPEPVSQWKGLPTRGYEPVPFSPPDTVNLKPKRTFALNRGTLFRDPKVEKVGDRTTLLAAQGEETPSQYGYHTPRDAQNTEMPPPPERARQAIEWWRIGLWVSSIVALILLGVLMWLGLRVSRARQKSV